jgi:high affinity Mn2+ porin
MGEDDRRRPENGGPVKPPRGIAGVAAAFFAVGFLFAPDAAAGLSGTPDGTADEPDQVRDAKPAPRFDWGFQTTVITQAAASFRDPYEGPRSFTNEGSARASTTETVTIFTAARLWKGAWASVQPEFSGGGGPGGGQGIAAYPNQDAVRAGGSVQQHPYIARAFLHQDFSLGRDARPPDPDAATDGRDADVFVADSNTRFAPGSSARRIEITAGKFSLADFFDSNDVAGDVHHRLMNWALVNDGAWDYAADARGYTWGLVVGVFDGPFALRLATAAMPSQANGIHFDTSLSDAHAENAELDWEFDAAHKGEVRLLGWINHARMGSYADALASAGPGPPDIHASRRAGRTKRGYGLNVQRNFGEWGVFLRGGWNDGRNESFAYTEIDRTVSGGLSHDAAIVGRKDDSFALAFVGSGLSALHRRYLEAGGIGFQLGDGRLNYSSEQVLEAHYNAQLTAGISLAADYQRVWNPGYNRDRGPISIYGLRVHIHP